MGPSKTESMVLAESPDEGVILMDLSLQVIACDAGGEAILRSENPRNGSKGLPFAIPEEVVSLSMNFRRGNVASGRSTVRIGEQHYICRAYVVEPRNRSTVQPTLVLHLHKDTAAADAVRQIAKEYDLTDREEQALLGLARGLTSREVAEEMDISPHTVKAYVRLIMIKMGVSRRAAIVGKLMEYNAGPSEATPASNNRRNHRS